MVAKSDADKFREFISTFPLLIHFHQNSCFLFIVDANYTQIHVCVVFKYYVIQIIDWVVFYKHSTNGRILKNTFLESFYFVIVSLQPFQLLTLKFV